MQKSRSSSSSRVRKAGAAEWPVADGKARFSELIAKAAEAPQTITRNGTPVAIVISVDEWKRKSLPKASLFEVLQSAPEGFADLDFSRAKGAPRDIEL